MRVVLLLAVVPRAAAPALPLGRARALRRLRQLKAWKQVLLGTLVTEQRGGSPHLWKLNGHSGLFKKIVASYVGGDTEPGLGPALP